MRRHHGVSGGTPPLWIDGESRQLWRLTHCVVSDIRMPSGIDGVQLLELLRRPNGEDTTDTINHNKVAALLEEY